MRTLMLIGAFLLVQFCAAQIMFGNRAGWSIFKQKMVLMDGYQGANIYEGVRFQSGGFAGAITIDLPINDRFVLGTEAGFSERGFISTSRVYAYREEFKAGYFNVSILPKMRIGMGSIRLEVFAGADLGRQLNVRTRQFGVILVMPAQTFEVDRTRAEFLNTMAISLVGGGGLVLGNGPALLHLNIRYVQALSAVYDRDLAFTTLDGQPLAIGNQFDRSFVFSIGYSLPLAARYWKIGTVPRGQ